MTGETEPITQAINDARALLDTLLASEWQEMHLVSGGTEIFLARNGAGANPMRIEHAGASVTTAGRPETSVKMPHVATLVDILPVGTAVAVGETIATLRVLGEHEVIEAPVAGTIIRIDAVAGALLDYGAPLLAIAEAT